MAVTSIRLQHYRSYNDESFEFDPGVNIIVGPNASGKTNLLEALLLSSVGGSYRARDADLVHHGEPWARLDVSTETGLRVVKLVCNPDETVSKEYEIDGTKYKRLSLQKSYPVVLFEPNHLQLFAGSPERRREYLDGLLEQLVPGFSTTRRHYKRALAQRNALLKAGRASEQLFAWNIRLSQLAGQIVQQRLAVLERLKEFAQDLYQDLSSSKATVELLYVSRCRLDQYSSDLLHKLEQSIPQDMERGFTSYGPHREDFAVRLNGYIASSVASRGETRSLTLVLKILELRLLLEARGTPPLLLLDDVFSELDGARRRALTETLSAHQTFITTTDADVVLKHFTDHANILALGS